MRESDRNKDINYRGSASGTPNHKTPGNRAPSLGATNQRRPGSAVPNQGAPKSGSGNQRRPGSGVPNYRMPNPENGNHKAVNHSLSNHGSVNHGKSNQKAANHRTANSRGSDRKGIRKKSENRIGLAIGLSFGALALLLLMLGAMFFIFKEDSSKYADENKADWTIMIFMSGSNLEHDAGAMSKTIRDIKSAEYGDNINVIVQTGGSSKWFDEEINADKIQRWSIKNGELTLLEEADRDHFITTEGLSDFMSFAIKKCPAKRYGVILHSHGGGTLGGFGSDDFNPEDNIGIKGLQEAFQVTRQNTGKKFEFIGFDACLMATFDIAYALKDYGNYMIASEESETALVNYEDDGYNSWAYADWLTKLADNPSMAMNNTDEKSGLGRLICSSYFDSYNYNNIDNASELKNKFHTTLTLLDLSKMDVAYEAMCSFFEKTSDYITTSDASWNQIVSARSQCEGFGHNQYEQIDIIDFFNKSELPFEEMYDWQNAILDVIVYNRNDANNANGLAIYFPYYGTQFYNEVKKNLEAIGYERRYFDLYDPFVAKIQGLISASAGTVNGNYNSKAEETDNNDNNSNSALWDGPISFKDGSGAYKGYKVIPLTEQQRSAISSVNSQFLLNTDKGYVNLGILGGYARYDDAKEQLIGWDNITYVTSYGVSMPMQFVLKDTLDNGEDCYFHLTPAFVNDQSASIIVVSYYNNGKYQVEELGYVLDSDQEKSVDFQAGDKVAFKYTMLDENFEKIKDYKSKEVTIKDGLNLKVEESESDGKSRYVIYDIYENQYSSEWLNH